MLENLPWRYPATFVCLTCVQIWRPLARLQDLVHRSNISALTLTFLLGSAAWFQFAGSVSENELCSGSTFENLFYLFLYVIIWTRGCILQNIPLNSLNEILWILCLCSQILKGFWREWDKKVVSGSCGGWIPHSRARVTQPGQLRTVLHTWMSQLNSFVKSLRSGLNIVWERLTFPVSVPGWR